MIEIIPPMELIEEEIQREHPQSHERQGHNGGSQKSQRHSEVGWHSSKNALDAHTETNVAPGAKKSGTTLVIPPFESIAATPPSLVSA